MKFVKMQGAGNDYVYVDCFAQPEPRDPGALAAAMSAPHFGVGSDGLILILPSKAADVRMRMFNADGSEARMCGNGIRCLAKYVYEARILRRTLINVETLSGIKQVELIVDEGRDIVTAARVDMGAPVFDPVQIPVLTNQPGPVISLPLSAEGFRFEFAVVGMGSGHAVAFVEDVQAVDMGRIGPLFENHPAFPDRINVEFVQPIKQGRALKMRVWERGSGETMACGTGASAALVAAHLRGVCGRLADVHLPGGTLTIHWDGESGHVYMTGPAETVFRGEWPE